MLLKDNHVRARAAWCPRSKAALAAAPADLRVQVEVESRGGRGAALEAGADLLLLDNRSRRALRAIAQRLRGAALLEASGGVNLANVRAVAETGVQRISIGALTHSAPAADVALEVALGGRCTEESRVSAGPVRGSTRCAAPATGPARAKRCPRSTASRAPRSGRTSRRCARRGYRIDAEPGGGYRLRGRRIGFSRRGPARPRDALARAAIDCRDETDSTNRVAPSSRAQAPRRHDA